MAEVGDTGGMNAQRIVVIGASSGGIEALTTIVAALPKDFPAPICVVVHMGADSPGVLDRILSRAGALPAAQADSGMRLQAGHIYVSRPDHHLLIEPGTMKLSRGPRENRFRPAIDPLFRSAAQVFGPAAIGVVLTGNLDDGTAGLWAIRRLGGLAIVQDPEDAQFPSMPRSAIENVDVNYTVPLGGIAPLLTELVASAPPQGAAEIPRSLEVEVRIADGDNAREAGVETLGIPSPYACPDCHGVLLMLKASHPMRFRCHTGHAYSATSLVAALNDGIEDALWTAIRSLEEGALVMRHLAKHEPATRAGQGDDLVAQAKEAEEHSHAVRAVAVARDALRLSKA